MSDLVLRESLEACHALIRQLLTIIQHDHTPHEALGSRFGDLEARVNQNSRNSSRPPSSNFGRHMPKQKTEVCIPKAVKEQGGEKGHTGKTLEQIDHRDEIVELTTPFCSCGQILSIEQAVVVQTYQVFDLPQPKLSVTEYERLEQKCCCGRVHLAALPEHIHATVPYGAGVRALTTLLRELTYQKEQGKLWATPIHDFLLALYKRTEKGTIPVDDIHIVKAQWQKLCQNAIILEEILLAQQTPSPELTLFDIHPKKRGRKPRGKPLKLLDTLLLHTEAILAFAEFEAVPFSNNQAERHIRPIKTKLKVAGCFRTTQGANRYAVFKALFLLVVNKKSMSSMNSKN